VLTCLAALLAAAQSIDSLPPRHAPRTVAIDERLAKDAGLRLGDTVILAATPGAAGDTALVSAFVRRPSDPSEVAKGVYRIRVHLDELQQLVGYGERVERFAVGTRGRAATDSALRGIAAAAFGFRAYASREIAVESSTTFLVVSRFHRAIGVITIVASAVFLLCIMLLKVEERRLDAAVMRFVGVRRRTVFLALLLEAALIAAVGSVVGTGLAYVAGAVTNTYYRHFFDTSLTFSLITSGIVLFSIVLALSLGAFAGALAAWRLVHTHPLVLWGRG
jgi:putative ABC transport system permease protein